MAPIQRALLIFVAVPVLYSIGFFIWCCYAEKMPIFSKRNTRSIASVIRGHTIILMILMLLTEIAIGSYSSLPNWITEKIIPRRFGRDSIFELLCIAIVVSMAYVEKRWIYIEDDSASVNNTSGRN
jgi:hypothetical protein